MPGEPMALMVINKINGKLKVLYRKNRYLTKELRRMLCNALIQLHFDYACPIWYRNLDEKTKKKIEIMQNKCICFCLKLGKMLHISKEVSGLINWLPTSKRVGQCINNITFNSVNNTCPYYLNKIFEFALHCRITTRNNFSKFKNHFRKTNMGQKQFLILVLLSGRACLTLLKKTSSLNTFKHNVKKHYLNNT